MALHFATIICTVVGLSLGASGSVGDWIGAIQGCEEVELGTCKPLVDLRDAEGDDARLVVTELLHAKDDGAFQLGVTIATAIHPSGMGQPLAELITSEVDTTRLETLIELAGVIKTTPTEPLEDAILTIYDKAKDGIIRPTCLRVLGRLKSKKILPELHRLVVKGNMKLKFISVKAIKLIKAPESVIPLMNMLSTPDLYWPLRIEVIQALAAIGDSKAAPLVALSYSFSELELKRAVIRALGLLGAAHLSHFPLMALEIPELKSDAIMALGRMGAVDAIPTLVGLVSVPKVDAPTFEAVMWALGAIKSPTAVPALVAMLTGKDEARVAKVCQTLGVIGEPTAVPALIEVVDGKGGEASARAVWALQKVTGESLGATAGPWKEWLKAHPLP